MRLADGLCPDPLGELEHSSRTPIAAMKAYFEGRRGGEKREREGRREGKEVREGEGKGEQGRQLSNAGTD